ncbi:hypothetical protein ABFO79_06575 [Acinetobacter schindleri]|uniref:hypothetical protein n=1 Tax=Acinetobacter schindleri TaxID=108981 RepID=UPI003215F5D1
MFLSVEFLFFVGQNDVLLIKVGFRHVNPKGILCQFAYLDRLFFYELYGYKYAKG